MDDGPTGATTPGHTGPLLPTAGGAAPWSVPSPWFVPEPPRPAAAPRLTPGAPRRRPSRLTAALVAMVVLASAVAAWAAFDHLDIHPSRPATARRPAARPSRPDGFTGRPLPSPSSAVPDIDVNAVAARVQPGVVDIDTKFTSGIAGAGTGVIIASDGVVLTNNHVIEGVLEIVVTLVDTGRRYPATVMGTVPTEDIAVLRIAGAANLPGAPKLRSVPLGDSSKVDVGDPVVALGNARGAGGTPHTVAGNVDALNQTITATDQDGSNPENLSGLIQIDAALEPGDSGGPLIDRAGDVIGIDTAASASRRFRSVGDAIGFAIPINKAKALAAQIQAGQASATVHIGVPGLLGVVMGDTAGPGAGVSVTEVMPGSPAATAGLSAGDTLNEVDGQPATSADVVAEAVRRHRAGEPLKLSWTERSGRRREEVLVLASGPAD